jgi:hypothetical protein
VLRRQHSVGRLSRVPPHVSAQHRGKPALRELPRAVHRG